jgi:Ni,Fe-hydrogenase III large subunit/Ni,Fe-hydrogenase III component G
MADLGITTETLPGFVPARRARVDAAQWRAAAAAIREAGGRLVALWASDERDPGPGFRVHAAFEDASGLLALELPLPAAQPRYPSLDGLFPCAARMQRAAHDLFGVTAEGAADHRPWLRHDAWPADHFPLREDGRLPLWEDRDGPPPEDYPFTPVSGDGVHEIPVGPVHAGIIEPGHFRFSVVGEKVLRLEARLGYAHKGVEKRFEALALAEGHRLAARVSGDSAVAFSWAYCMAAEGIAGVRPPARASWLRALCLERERIANHLGDLGAIGNDAGFAFGLSQFSRLKEDWLRANAGVLGQRYLMDAVVPGGVGFDLDAAGRDRLAEEADRLEAEVRELHAIYAEHAGLQDRFIGCGRVPPPLAARLGLTGLAGRASSQSRDLRCDHPCPPYDQLEVRMQIHRNGDVAARVGVRFDEIFESLRLCRLVLGRLPPGEVGVPFGASPAGAFGLGWVEGWRGPVLVALESGPRGSIRRCHPHDPSWQNWPLVEHAVIDNIVPDFPLINKSFNLSYSGHDL